MAVLIPDWYVIYTHPQQERKIYANLLHQNLTAYLPLQTVIRRWSDRMKQLTTPLFPNYLFVRITDRERASVLKLAGVARFIAFEGRAAIIADEEIEIIRRLEGANAEPEPGLITGDRVQVMQGPFMGLDGVLFRKMGRARFSVRLQGLRQTVSLDIDENLLRKL